MLPCLSGSPVADALCRLRDKKHQRLLYPFKVSFLKIAQTFPLLYRSFEKAPFRLRENGLLFQITFSAVFPQSSP